MAHPKQGEYNKRLRRKKIQIKRGYMRGRGCQRCPERHPACLDLHHRNPEEKHPVLKSGHKASRWWLLSFAELAIELEKCDVLCSNCHRKLEWTGDL